MHDRRSVLGIFAATAAFGAWGLRPAGAQAEAQTYIRDPVLGLIPVCRGEVQLADAVGGNSANLTGERADFDLMEKLGLLEGHLMIGKALLEARMAADAMPHFGHPAEEIYTYLEAQIQRRGVPAFKDELVALERQARNGAAPPFPAMYDAVMAKVAALRATIPAALRGSGRFAIGVVAQLVLDVASDYESAIEHGRIANTVEYHDAMGFLVYCEALRAANAQGAPPARQRIYRAVARELAQAQRAFPALRPPARPPITVAAMRGHAARIADLAKDL